MRATPLLALALLAGACGGGDDGPGVRTGASVGLSAELRQYREDQAPRLVQVAVTTRDGVTVLGAQVQAPGFVLRDRISRDDPIPAGQTTNVPVPYGEADCAVSPGPATVLLSVRLPSGEATDVALPVTDPTSVLGRVHLDDCKVRAVLAQVRLSLSPDWRSGTATDPVRRGSVRLERVSGDARVVVTEVQRNTLFGVTSPRLAVLEPGTASVEQVLEVRPIAACNVHALAESKRATIFGLYVSVGGAQPVLVTVAADDALKADLLALAGAGCSTATS